MSPLTIHIDRGPVGRALVRLMGPLDAHTAKQLEASVNDLFEEGIHRLIFNLHQVDYLASTGVMLFVITQRRLRESGGEMVIVKPLLPIMEIFRLLGLHDLFTFVTDENEAWSALK